MSEPGKAVFLSYASQDAEAAKRIADALRAAGVEVWFDQSELVGGDAWDAKIRQQLSDCALFMPVISANTQARREGYFRLEWKLAAQRTHMMSDDTPFLLPLVVDDTKDAEARVPVEFKAVQWTRLPGGAASAAFCDRVKKILTGDVDAGSAPPPGPRGAPADSGAKARKPDRMRYAWMAVGLVFALVYAVRPLWPEKAKDKPAAPKAPNTLFSEAQKLERQARALIDVEPLAVRETFRTAHQLCEKAAALSPGEAEVWATMARANVVLIGLYQEGGTERVAAARSQAEKALSLAPDSIEAGLAMAAVELALLAVDPLAVRARLEALLRRAPDDHRILLLLAQTEDGDTVSETAFRWLARAEALPAGKAPAALRQAWIFWGANRLRESLEAVERSLAAQPLSETYHLKLMLLKTMGENESAQAWVKQIPPVVLREDRAAMMAYETLYFARKPEEALRVLRVVPREVLEEGRFFDVRALLVAEALLMAGKTNAAEVELHAAHKVIEERLATNPRHGRLWHAKGRVQFHLGDRAGAERSFSTAAELGGLREIELAAQAMLLGRSDDTLALIDRTLNRQLTRWPSWLHYFRLHPVFDPLRGNPRYHQLLARAEAWLAEDLLRPHEGAPGIAAAKAGDPSFAKAAVDASGMAVPPDAKSVAVLAFANLSDDKANEYFSDGISEELLNVLAKVPGLAVRGRSSGFYFKGRQVKSAEIGQQLNVNYLVQGSVRRAGDRVRISAQLIRAATDEVVWSSGSLDRDLKDIFAVQDEIAGLIAKNLSVSMGVTARAPHQVNPEALTALLEGRQFWLLRTMEGFARAGVLFRRAVELDPDWAPAHAALSNLMTIEASYRRGGGESVSERFVLAAQAAKRAIELDPALGEPHAALGKIAMENLKFAEAGEEFRRALALEPNNALVRDWYGDLLVTQGRLDLAIVEYRRAAEIEPLSPYILWDLAWELMHVRRYDESLALVERAIALTPNGAPRLTIRRARLLLELGRKAEAEAALRPFLDGFRADSDPQIANEMIWCLQRLGLTPDRERWTAELLRQSPGSFSSGVILLLRGEEDRAYPLMEKCPPIFWQQIYWDPVFDPMRETPRFRQVLEKLGCVAEYQVARETRARLLKEQERGK